MKRFIFIWFTQTKPGYYFLFTLVVGCVGKPDPSATIRGQGPASIYDLLETQSLYGRAQQFRLNESEKERLQLENSDLRISTQKTDSSTEVYALRKSDLVKYLVIPPKAFFRTSSLGNGSETYPSLSISGHLALVDGLSTHLYSHAQKFPTPSSLLINWNPLSLPMNELGMGDSWELKMTYQCPETLKFRFGEQTSQARLGYLPAFCATNQLYPATLTLLTPWARDTETSSPALQAAEVTTTLSLDPTQRTEIVRIELDASAFANALHARLGSFNSVPDTEVDPVLRQCLGVALQSLSVELTPSAFDNLVSDLKTAHFQTLRGLSGKTPLLRLYSQISRPLEKNVFEYQKPFSISPSLQIEIPGVFSGAAPIEHNLTLNAPTADLFNDSTPGKLSRLPMPLRQNEVIDLTITSLSIPHVSQKNASIAKQSNLVCKNPYSVCESGNWKCISKEVLRTNKRRVCQDERTECLYIARNPWLSAMGSILEYEYRKYCYFPGNGDFYTEAESERAKSLGCSVEKTTDSSTERNWKEDEHRDSKVCFQIGIVCHKEAYIFDEKPECEALSTPALPSLPFRLDSVKLNSSKFEWNCTSQSDNHCADSDWEDHWVEVTHYPLPLVEGFEQIDSLDPELLSSIVDGLEMVFSSPLTSSELPLACPLKSFVKGNAESGTIRLEIANNDSCAPFEDLSSSPNSTLNVSIRNSAKISKQIPCGTVSRHWNGTVTRECNVSQRTRVENQKEHGLRPGAATDPIMLTISLHPEIRARFTISNHQLSQPIGENK
jgi:hypothetical protein